jgi:hypothetical protein
MWEGPQCPDSATGNRGAEAAPTLLFDRTELALLLNEFRDKPGPASLM